MQQRVGLCWNGQERTDERDAEEGLSEQEAAQGKQK
jgi:hypothetical protein